MLAVEVTPLGRRYALPLVSALAVLGALGSYGWLHDGGGAGFVGGLVPALLVLALTLGTLRPGKAYPAHVDNRGVLRDGELSIARKDLVAGQVVTYPAGHVADVLLVGRRGMPSPLLRVRDRETARDVLRALGLDEEQTLVTRVVPWTPVLHLLPFTLTALASLAAIALFVATAASESVVRPIALVAFIASLLVVSSAAILTLKIGREGLVLSTLGQRRFHAFADLDAIRPWRSGLGTPKGVDLVFAGGKVVPLYTRTFKAPGVPDDVLEQIESAWRRYRAAREVAETAKMQLTRGGRELDAWARDLLQIGRVRPGYRERSLEPEDLAALVESPAAGAEERVAAAFALTAAGPDPELRHRVRVAADAAAAPELREALRDLAELEDEAPRVAALRRLGGG